MSFRKLKTAAIGIVGMTPRFGADEATEGDLEVWLDFAISPL
jgi:hypothetical protein